MRTVTTEVIEIPSKFKNPTGLFDILPHSQRYWQYAEDVLNKVSTSFGFTRVITPPVEARSLYTSVFGNAMDDQLVSSDISTDGEQYVLKAHPRISIIRSFKENRFNDWPPPVHLFYPSNTIRKTPTGYAQEHYFCLDVLGAKDTTTSTSMLALLHKLSRELHLKTAAVTVHSGGCAQCKPAFAKAFAAFIKKHQSSLCPDCAAHPTIERIATCETDSKQSWLEELPPMLDFLCPSCHDQLTNILELSDQLSIPYDVDPMFFVNQPEAEQTTFNLHVGSETIPAIVGYHYNSFGSMLAEQPLSAIGITVDLKRLSSYLEEYHVPLPYNTGIQIFVAQLGEQAKAKCVPILQQLYSAGYSAITACECESITNQLQVAERLHAKVTLIIGQKEAINNHVIMRDMVSGLQDSIYIDDLIPTLTERFALI